MTIEELNDILAIDESYRIERTISTGNMDKFQEAICAFANDLPGKRQKGYLLIGVYDDGRISGLKVDDDLMKKLACTQLFANCSELVKALIINFEYREMTSSELQLGPQLGPQLGQKSQRYFKKICLYPALELKLLAQTYPENSRHPRQKYYLTELGKAFQQYLKKNQK